MAAYALLIGTKGGKRSLVLDGNPLEIRRLFKTSDGEGFETLEVIESTVGRTRKRQFKAKQDGGESIAKKAAKKSSKSATDSDTE
jgi:hypothetical protein